ncbi:LmeA family phospholipid-binding protein [Pseudonocardia spinosispora]|uniref:LmeA family phospholipid-binding protein n=1 Tax=Pseudonocardia spinosispora TaxID=103441 RepID=UPI0004295C98|nr:DUF2993 domain-containing protein [Pseudonocardia spinosispora]
MKRIVIGLIVAIVLLVAVDFAAASAAEYQVSAKMREQLALPDDPAVKINGFPFLTQAFAGDYSRVDVEANYLAIGKMENLGIRTQLFHVRVPFSQVISGSVRSIRVDNAEGTVRIMKDDLMRQMSQVTPITKLTVSPVDDGALDAALADSGKATPGSSVTGINPDSAVRLGGVVSFLGQKMNVQVIAVLNLAGNQIQITPRDIRIGSGAEAAQLPQLVQTQLRKLFTVKVDPGVLPFSVTPTRLRAVPDALEISGVAHDVVLGSPTQPTTSTSNN